MHTPYDSALRVQKRAMDAIRLSLLVEVAREHAINTERKALDVSLIREGAIAAMDWQLAAHPYGQRLRAHRVRLDGDHRGVDANLNRLRGAAMEACGQMRAVAGAATSFATAFVRKEAAAEQAQADDFAGARTYSQRRQPAFAAAPR